MTEPINNDTLRHQSGVKLTCPGGGPQSSCLTMEKPHDSLPRSLRPPDPPSDLTIVVRRVCSDDVFIVGVRAQNGANYRQMYGYVGRHGSSRPCSVCDRMA